MAHSSSDDKRPLSPHLQVYRPSITMVMSIIHRLTGVALYLGTLLLAWWLIAIAQGPKYFEYVSAILGSMPGKIVLFGYTWALIHHMLGGIRHLIWDTGRGFNLGTVNVMSWATIIGSITITLALWTVAYGLKGMF